MELTVHRPVKQSRSLPAPVQESTRPQQNGRHAPSPDLNLQPVPITTIPVRAPVQQDASGNHEDLSPGEVHSYADKATAGVHSEIPNMGALQKSLPDHDLSFIRAHTDNTAQQSTKAMGAKAFARGDRVAFAETNPSLHTVAHEVAHSLQQKAGISIASGVGSVGDRHEQQADAVADAVVSGRNASSLLSSSTQVP